MTCSNPKLDLAKMNAYIQFCEILPIGSQDIVRAETKFWHKKKNHNSGTSFRKMTCNNPKLDLVNMNAYIKFGENMSSSSQDIERKRNFSVNQGPKLWYKFAKNFAQQCQGRSCQYKCTYKI